MIYKRFANSCKHNYLDKLGGENIMKCIYTLQYCLTQMEPKLFRIGIVSIIFATAAAITIAIMAASPQLQEQEVNAVMNPGMDFFTKGTNCYL